MDPDLIDHSGSIRSPLGARGWIDVDQVRPELRDMRSTGSMDLIHSEHPDPRKIFSRCSLCGRFADNLIARAFSIISHPNLSAPPFCACVSGVHGLNEMPTLLHQPFVLIRFISLSDRVTLISKLYRNASQVTKSCVNGRFSSSLADCVKYVMAIPVASHITTITQHTTALSPW